MVSDRRQHLNGCARSVRHLFRAPQRGSPWPPGLIHRVPAEARPFMVKGLASRKPPEPSANHSEIDAWMKTLVPHLQPIVKDLDKSIRASVPDLHFAVKYKRPFYGQPERGWIIELAPYDVSVNVLIFGAADFDSPPKLGSADRTRYVKVTDLEQARRPELKQWFEQADRSPGWR